MILISRIETPIGEMTAGATSDGICFLEFGYRCGNLSGYGDLSGESGTDLKYGSNRHIKALKKQLKEYFTGKRKEFNLNFGKFLTEKRYLTLNRLIPLIVLDLSGQLHMQTD